ncbi:MAG: hypothetical protein RL217_627 [Pseudomonadota bacterium]|jgi:competence protein ComEC
MPVFFLLSAFAVVLGTLIPLELYTALLCVLLALLLRKKAWRWPILLLLFSLSYGQLWLDWELNHRLPLHLDKTQVSLRLQVQAVKPRPYGWTILAQVLPDSALAAQGLPMLRRVSLNGYQNPSPAVGSQLQVQARLRSPRGFSNDLAFDYEAWLISQRIDATGSLRSWQVLGTPLALSWRDRLLQDGALRYGAAWPWLSGLVLGEQQAFSKTQWDLAKRTGTVHILVVSGLHLSLVLLLGLGLWQVGVRLLRWVWPRNPPYLLLLRSVFLLSLAALYLYVAGMGVALWRAWLMLALLLLLQQSRWRLPWLTAISVALWLLLLANPLAWCLTGFQYSFAAVAVLLVFFSYRRNSKLEALWRPQVVLFVAMLPLMLYWSQPVSLLQCLANLLAIPYVSFVLLPVALLQLLFPTALGLAVLTQAGELFWAYLAQVQALPWPYLSYLPSVVVLLWPLWLWLWWKALPATLQALAVLVFGVLLFGRPLPHEVQARLLDVGQGQSMIFTTAHKALLYDTGPLLGELDTGDAIVRPSLQRLAVQKLDVLVVSHADSDHAGGAEAVLSSFAVQDFYASEAMPLSQVPKPCHKQGQDWQRLDEHLAFRFFSLPEPAFLKIKKTRNNLSCVVQLQWYGQRFLLVGDIGKEVEQALVIYYGAELKSDLLLLAHHGSRNSSAQVFLQTVQPKEVWISSGFHNSYGHPDAQVLARLQTLGIPWRNTAEEGALVWDKSGQIPTPKRLWRRPWQVQEERKSLIAALGLW